MISRERISFFASFFLLCSCAHSSGGLVKSDAPANDSASRERVSRLIDEMLVGWSIIFEDEQSIILLSPPIVYGKNKGFCSRERLYITRPGVRSSIASFETNGNKLYAFNEQRDLGYCSRLELSEYFDSSFPGEARRLSLEALVSVLPRIAEFDRDDIIIYHAEDVRECITEYRDNLILEEASSMIDYDSGTLEMMVRYRGCPAISTANRLNLLFNINIDNLEISREIIVFANIARQF